MLIHNRSYASPYAIVSVIPSPVTETYPSSHVLWYLPHPNIFLSTTGPS